MGFFQAPKQPAPPPLPEAPSVETVDQTKLASDRLRRARAVGTGGNIVSNLSTSQTDTQAQTRISKLLG